MILYHGSNIDISNINLNMCRPFKDFGRGFYLTLLEEQAKKMAVRVSKIYGGSRIINVYEIDDNFLFNTELAIKNFGAQVSPEWAVFVMNNRNRNFIDASDPLCNLDCKYDIVTGPIANDDMVLLFREFRNRAISQETLLRELTYKEVTNQVSFHTEKALKLLRKVETIYE